ncbi:MAG TPA: exonuclease domain-containing protein [Armatimonadota bacterium]|nr:exonuclease domain-containing protein [Armatimonadota bacterium]
MDLPRRMGVTDDAELASTELVVLDVETTGLSPRSDRVIEIALCRSLDGNVVETYETLVNPGRPIGMGASAVNGIYDADVRDAPRFSEIAGDVKEFLGDAVLVCHNAPFDLGFLGMEMRRAGVNLPSPRVFDTLRIARANFRFRSNSLSAIARELEIPTPVAHRALADALTTHAVFHRFTAELCRGATPMLDRLVAAQGGAFHFEWSQVAPGCGQDEGLSSLALPPELQEALASSRRLRLEYVDTSGRRTKRLVTPLEVYENGYVYLLAFCHLRKAERHFRLDRVVTMRVERQ